MKSALFILALLFCSTGPSYATPLETARETLRTNGTTTVCVYTGGRLTDLLSDDLNHKVAEIAKDMKVTTQAMALDYNSGMLCVAINLK